MSTCLEVSQADIKETVRRDRCDWLAAIFNLLIDQPEGRAVLQGAGSDNLIDQLTDASQLQGGSEHLKLSQGASQGKGCGHRGGLCTHMLLSWMQMEMLMTFWSAQRLKEVPDTVIPLL